VLAQCEGMMTFTELASVPSDPMAPFTDRLRLAVAAYLARFKGSSRQHTESDLRCYLAWCAEHGLDPLGFVGRQRRGLVPPEPPVTSTVRSGSRVAFRCLRPLASAAAGRYTGCGSEKSAMSTSLIASPPPGAHPMIRS